MLLGTAAFARLVQTANIDSHTIFQIDSVSAPTGIAALRYLNTRKAHINTQQTISTTPNPPLTKALSKTPTATTLSISNLQSLNLFILYSF